MLVHVDGFDHVSTADYLKKWTAAAPGSIISSAITRFGVGQACRLTTTGHSLSTAIPPHATIIGGAAFRFPQMNPGHIWCCGNGGYGATSQVGISVTSGGNIQAWRSSNNPGFSPGGASSGFNNAIGAPSVNALAINTWYYIEVKAVIHASAGTVEVRVNGSSAGWINLTGQNTLNSGPTASIAGFGVPVAGADLAYLDDCYLANGDTSDPLNNIANFLGDVRVVTIFPSLGNGSNVGFTPSTGTDHGAMVDDPTPDDDTTYNSSSVVGQIDTYNYPPVGLAGTVKAIQIVNYAKKDVAGTCEMAAMAGATPGTSVTVATDYVHIKQVSAKNPLTGLAWLTSEIDALEFGIKRTL